jgi:hypothetical protein
VLAFTHDLRKASKIYDYANKESDVVHKANRKLAIGRLDDMLNDNKLFLELFVPNFKSVMEMITVNIFLNLHYPNQNTDEDNLSVANTTIDTKNMMIDNEPAWPHMQGIFNIFYKLVQTNSYFTVKLQEYINQDFMKNVTII